MSDDGLELLKPFLPGLEEVLEDPEVSEIMINGPHNVWIEGHGKLYSHDAPLLNASTLNRAAIHIARPLGLDPATAPIVDARLEDGSRVAICVPPASPKVAITVRRFGKAGILGGGPGRTRGPPRDCAASGGADVIYPPQHPGFWRHRFRQDHAAQRAH